MWYLEGFRAKDFQTFKDIEYCIEQGVTSLVFGENLDNPIQKSNGSGKSTIGEIVVVGTRGTPMKNVRIDEVINNNATKAFVEVVYRNNETQELMIISRELFKKSSNTVSLYMEKNGIPVNESEYTQSSASGYNDFIFKTLGITEEEFINNFVISKHRYVSFLDANDKTKKDIINKLSNADSVIDPAVSLLKKDLSEYQDRVKVCGLKIASLNGSIDALHKQIEKLQKETGNEDKKERENRAKKQIEAYTDELFQLESQLSTILSDQSAVKVADDIAGSLLEDWNIEQIKEFLESSIDSKTHPATYRLVQSCINTVTMSEQEIKTKQEEIAIKNHDIQEFIDKIKSKNEILEDLTLKINEINSKVNKAIEDTNVDKENIQSSFISLKEEYEKINTKISDNKKKISIFEKEAGKISSILAGTIVCPKCKHQFVLDSDINVDEARNKLAEINEHKNTIKNTISSLEIESGNIMDSITSTNAKKVELEDKLQQTIAQIQGILPSIKSQQVQLQEYINKCDSEINIHKNAISNINKNITSINDRLLADIDDIVYAESDRLAKIIDDTKNKIEYKRQAIVTAKEGLEQLYKSTVQENIISIKEDIKKYSEERREHNLKYDVLNNKLNELTQQTFHFSGFKTYLANTKIEALSQEINNFLEAAGSDIRIELSGFTKNKSGDIREKISISIVRDGINFGSYGKLSEGEKATAQVATILAQLKLININAPSTKGLNLLIIDEIIDMIDTRGLSKIFNVLNNEGVTSLIVSHGAVNENYPHKVLVRKKHGISSIDVCK